MKILFLAEPFSANTISWARGLEELGCEVTIASARVPKGDPSALPIGPSFLPPRIRLLIGVGDVRRIIVEKKPDIVIGYRVTSYGYLGAASGFHPLVIAAQNERIAEHPTNSVFRSRLLRRFAERAIKSADLIHSWAPNITSGLKRYGADEGKILELHRGIDTGVFRPSGDRAFDRERPVVISTRSLYPQYRLETLLMAFGRFMNKFPGARLVFLGSGPEERRLKGMCVDMGLEKSVSFKGKLPPAEVAAELNAADIYVSLIETEGLSSSLLESCGCGVFPIVGDIPASRIIIKDRENGMLLKSMEAENVANAMAQACGDAAMLEAGRRINTALVREKFDRRKNLQRFLDEYKRLAGK